MTSAHWRLASVNLCPLVMWNRRVCDRRPALWKCIVFNSLGWPQIRITYTYLKSKAHRECIVFVHNSGFATYKDICNIMRSFMVIVHFSTHAQSLGMWFMVIEKIGMWPWAFYEIDILVSGKWNVWIFESSYSDFMCMIFHEIHMNLIFWLITIWRY